MGFSYSMHPAIIIDITSKSIFPILKGGGGWGHGKFPENETAEVAIFHSYERRPSQKKPRSWEPGEKLLFFVTPIVMSLQVPT